MGAPDFLRTTHFCRVSPDRATVSTQIFTRALACEIFALKAFLSELVQAFPDRIERFACIDTFGGHSNLCASTNIRSH